MGIHIPTVTLLGVSSKKRPLRNLLRTGQDIQLFGILLILIGIFDLIWIAACPHYSLKIFGTTLQGMGRRKISTPCYPLDIGIWIL